MNYSSSQVATLFQRTKQTISVWGREFAEYLSPTATPDGKKKRLFTRDDLAVFALVAELQDHGFTFPEIHAGLKAGQRGYVPDIDPTEVQAIIHSDGETRLALENERLRQFLIQAHEALKEAQERLKELDMVRSDRDKIAGQLESERRLFEEERERLQTQINKLTEELTRLATDAGHQYAKGMMDALREQGQFPPKKE
jgi:DNA-binding transcriptional MerR regulator